MDAPADGSDRRAESVADYGEPSGQGVASSSKKAT
jgi:hypothetical protein